MESANVLLVISQEQGRTIQNFYLKWVLLQQFLPNFN